MAREVPRNLIHAKTMSSRDSKEVAEEVVTELKVEEDAITKGIRAGDESYSQFVKQNLEKQIRILKLAKSKFN